MYSEDITINGKPERGTFPNSPGSKLSNLDIQARYQQSEKNMKTIFEKAVTNVANSGEQNKKKESTDTYSQLIR